MAGGGRIAGKVKRTRAQAPGKPVRPAPSRHAPHRIDEDYRRPNRLLFLFNRWSVRLSQHGVPRYAGLLAAGLFLIATAIYGVAIGGHGPAIAESLRDTRDAAAKLAGFEIEQVAISGNKNIRRDEVLSIIGISDRRSLLFLDAGEAREKLQAVPWIAEATIQKLYPNRVVVTLKEREAFALWQTRGKVQVIAADGTVIGPLTDRRFTSLPLVVGQGAATRAKAFLAQLEAFPAVREKTRAAILVADRRWNLRLKNGMDIKLPEEDIPRALATLEDLDRRKGLMNKDIQFVDLRLPDRVTVRLSEAAAKERDDALKAKKKKGTDA